MNKTKLLIVGASDHAKYTIDILEMSQQFLIIGVIDDNLKKGSVFRGYSILGSVSDLKIVTEKYNVSTGIIAVGTNFVRKWLAEEVVKLIPKFKFISAVHPSAIIGKNTTIGVGCVVMAGVIVNNDCIIKSHCFLATKSSLDHDSIMNDYSSFSPGVTTGGNVFIGTCCAIGVGANIIHNVSIGEHTVIGAGSVVVKNIPNLVVSLGIPAKVIRSRIANEPYL